MTPFHKTLSGGSRVLFGWSLWVDAGRRSRGQLSRRTCALGLIASDALALALAFVVVLIVREDAADLLSPAVMLESTSIRASFVEFGLILAGMVAWLTANGHYHNRRPFWGMLRQVVLATGVAILCNGFIEYAFKTDTSRTLVIGTWLLFPVLLLLTRHATIRLLQAFGIWTIRTVVVGDGPGAARIVAALTSESRLGYEIVGQVDTDVLAPPHASGRDLLNRFGGHLLVLASAPGERQTFLGLEAELIRERTPFAVMPQTQGLPLLASEQTYFPEYGLLMMSFWKGDAQMAARIGKLMFDLVVAGISLVLLSPLMVAIAVAVRMDGGPVFYAHARLGARRRRFGCLKFRSMRTNSAAMLQDVLLTDPARAAEWVATQKLRDDPRITRVGAFLRATSLDELPQLFNVLRLEMSLVGPRPIVDDEVAHYGADIAYYDQARPGLTGLWQVSGRSDVDYPKRVQLDVSYVKNWTLWHDFAILYRTLPAVLKRTGAI